MLYVPWAGKRGQCKILLHHSEQCTIQNLAIVYSCNFLFNSCGQWFSVGNRNCEKESCNLRTPVCPTVMFIRHFHTWWCEKKRSRRSLSQHLSSYEDKYQARHMLCQSMWTSDTIWGMSISVACLLLIITNVQWLVGISYFSVCLNRIVAIGVYCCVTDSPEHPNQPHLSQCGNTAWWH